MEQSNIIPSPVPTTSNVEATDLSPEDKHTLELAKMKKALARALAEKALAQNETGEIAYNNIVLQLSIKYGLTSQDIIEDDGTLNRGGVSKEAK